MFAMNNDKTKINTFSMGNVTYHPAFKFGHSNIEVVADYVYPGLKLKYIVVFNQLLTNNCCNKR